MELSNWCSLQDMKKGENCNQLPADSLTKADHRKPIWYKKTI
jgi:hypothetical protein